MSTPGRLEQKSVLKKIQSVNSHMCHEDGRLRFLCNFPNCVSHRHSLCASWLRTEHRCVSKSWTAGAGPRYPARQSQAQSSGSEHPNRRPAVTKLRGEPVLVSKAHCSPQKLGGSPSLLLFSNVAKGRKRTGCERAAPRKPCLWLPDANMCLRPHHVPQFPSLPLPFTPKSLLLIFSLS